MAREVIVNTRVLQQIMQEQKKLKRLVVDVGILGKEGQDIVNIGFWNEFGTRRIPQRSFIFSTVQEKKSQIKTISASSVNRIMTGRSDTVTELNKLGIYLSAEITKKIVKLRTPPNAPGTIRQKGSDNPLVDTGRLSQSIDYAVRNPI